MDRTLDIHRTIIEWTDAGRPFVLALILAAEGSTPRKQGIKAVIDATGRIAGTIGGGWVEAEAQRCAARVCPTGKPAILHISLNGIESDEDAPLCGGGVKILLDPTASVHRAAYAAALDALLRREGGVLVTTVTGDDATPAATVAVSVRWCPADRIPEATGFPGAEALRACLTRESAKLFRAEEPAMLQVFVEPLVPDPRLLIAGGGHIGQALAAQASALGFDVTVVDDRPEFTDTARYPEGVATRCGDIAGEIEAFPIGPDTYIVIVTRGHKQDAAALSACIRSRAAYVGMIGSRRKVSLLRADFIDSGRATQEEFDRVFTPIGLDIGAVTVPEIATSIAAQLVATRRRGAAAARSGSMKAQ